MRAVNMAEAEFFLSALDEAADAEMELEFLATFFERYRRTSSVHTSVVDALGEHGIA